MEKFLDGLDSFQAAFEQTLLGEDGEALEKSVGVVYIKRPGRFHWHYYEPYSQYLISDGKNLWVYDEDLEQVTIRDIAGSMKDTPAAILGGEVDIDEHYVVIDEEDEGDIDWLELTPRDIESQYETLRLGFQENLLAAMILFDSLGQETRISFLHSQRNPELKRSLFRFEPPENVDVIDDR
ncbi:MAG: outer membrane lipoprotein chaperone LolA [Gammaproteobacteria bacterium]